MQDIPFVIGGHAEIADYLYADKTTIQQLRNASFNLIIRDSIFWPANLMQDLLEIPSVEIFFVPLGMPFMAQAHSIPNMIAYNPQVASELTPDMVRRFIYMPCISLIESRIVFRSSHLAMLPA